MFASRSRLRLVMRALRSFLLSAAIAAACVPPPARSDATSSPAPSLNVPTMTAAATSAPARGPYGVVSTGGGVAPTRGIAIVSADGHAVASATARGFPADQQYQPGHFPFVSTSDTRAYYLDG